MTAKMIIIDKFDTLNIIIHLHYFRHCHPDLQKMKSLAIFYNTFLCIVTFSGKKYVMNKAVVRSVFLLPIK